MDKVICEVAASCHRDDCVHRTAHEPEGCVSVSVQCTDGGYTVHCVPVKAPEVKVNKIHEVRFSSRGTLNIDVRGAQVTAASYGNVAGTHVSLHDLTPADLWKLVEACCDALRGDANGR